MTTALMPQTAQPGECAYCLRPVSLSPPPPDPKRPGASIAMCLRCERVIAAGGSPPVAMMCQVCKGVGREECPDCHGNANARADAGCEKTHHDWRGWIECVDCLGRGMVRG